MSLKGQAEQAALYMAAAENRVLLCVQAERLRQDARWGEQNHEPYKWLAILLEELGEAAQEALTEDVGADGNGHGDLRGELVQVAAVAVAWIEALDRNSE